MVFIKSEKRSILKGYPILKKNLMEPENVKRTYYENSKTQAPQG
jgi:hypothetical protein